MELAHKTSSEPNFGFPVVSTPVGEKAIDINRSVNGTYNAGTVDEPTVKIKPLLAINRFDLDAFNWTNDQPNAVECIVDAQGSFFVGSENHAASKLFVEIADRKVHFSCGVRVPGVAVANAGAEATLLVDEVTKGIEAGLFGWNNGADDGVFAVTLPEHLKVSRNASGLPLLSLTECECWE